MRAWIVGTLTIVALGVTPAIASAETITETGNTVTVQAAPGEDNDLSEQANATNLRFSDFGRNLDGSSIAVTPGGTCVTVTANSVDCPAAGVTVVAATMLDQGDEIELGGLPATVNVLATGGDGNDDINGGPGNDVISGGAGNDDLDGSGGNDVIDGGSGDDDLNGDNSVPTPGNDILTGDSGNDELNGDQGDDTLSGGDGEDRLSISPGNDTISGGDGNRDELDGDGTAENLTISLDGVANDTSSLGTDNVMPDVEDIVTGSGDDTITGSAGNNEIESEAGDDTVNGGDGDDYIELGDGNDVGSGANGDDDVFGDDGNDTVDGGPGDDVVEGDSGTDAITGGDGNDLLEPGAGADSISGGAGIDTVDYGEEEFGEEDFGGVSASLDGVANDGQPGDNQNIGTDVENISGSEGNDVITGGTGSNVLIGGDGSDVINSRDAGPDLVQCGPGYDTVNADGFDTINDTVSLCESVNLGSLTNFGPIVGVVFSSHATKTVKLTATCPTTATGYCQATVSLKAASKTAGSVTFLLLPGETEVESIKLSSAAVKSLKKNKKLKVTATVTAHDNRGATSKKTQTKTLTK